MNTSKTRIFVLPEFVVFLVSTPDSNPALEIQFANFCTLRTIPTEEGELLLTSSSKPCILRRFFFLEGDGAIDKSGDSE